MDFKRKLATLPPPTPSATRLPAVDAALGEPGHGDKASTLHELREKMAAILALATPHSRSPNAPSRPVELGEVLPFQREERLSGPLFRRHQILPPSHHVGRMPVDAAASSRAEL